MYIIKYLRIVTCKKDKWTLLLIEKRFGFFRWTFFFFLFSIVFDTEYFCSVSDIVSCRAYRNKLKWICSRFFLQILLRFFSKFFSVFFFFFKFLSVFFFQILFRFFSHFIANEQELAIPHWIWDFCRSLRLSKFRFHKRKKKKKRVYGMYQTLRKMSKWYIVSLMKWSMVMGKEMGMERETSWSHASVCQIIFRITPSFWVALF